MGIGPDDLGRRVGPRPFATDAHRDDEGQHHGERDDGPPPAHAREHTRARAEAAPMGVTTECSGQLAAPAGVARELRERTRRSARREFG